MHQKQTDYPIPLDPNHERYRKCPFCGREFMTSHRARVYCNQYCHDHFNVDKRLKAQQTVIDQASAPISTGSSPQTVAEHPNLNLLRWLPHHPDGLEIDFQWLLSLGYDPDHFDQRIELDTRGQVYYLTEGEFMLFWTAPEKILIYRNA